MVVYVLIHGEYSDAHVVGVFDETCGKILQQRFPEDDDAYGAHHVVEVQMNDGHEFITQGLFSYEVEMVLHDGSAAQARERYADNFLHGGDPEAKLFKRHTGTDGDPTTAEAPMDVILTQWPVWAVDAAQAIAKAEALRQSYLQHTREGHVS